MFLFGGICFCKSLSILIDTKKQTKATRDKAQVLSYYGTQALCRFFEFDPWEGSKGTMR